MTVLYFADTRFPIERANGVQTMATCAALAERGHAVTLVVRPDPNTPARDPFEFYGVSRNERLTFAAIPAAGGPHARRIRFLLQAAAMASRERSAIVYTRDLGLAAFLLQIPAVRRPRVIYESHGVAPIVAEEQPRLLGRADLVPSRAKLERLDRRERRVWTRAAAYVAITRALSEDLAARYGTRDAVFVAPDGADPPAGTNAPQPMDVLPDQSGPPLVAYAGHLYPWKGVDVFVEALARVPNVSGLIVGGHPAEPDRARVEALTRALNLTPRVEMPGLVPPREVASRLAPASMLVLPNVRSTISERYTSPLKLFEYLWLGRPIIASNLTAVREIVQDDVTALLVEPGDPVALADAITRLAADRPLSQRLGRAARALAPAFTWGKRAERIEAALAAAAP